MLLLLLLLITVIAVAVSELKLNNHRSSSPKVAPLLHLHSYASLAIMKDKITDSLKAPLTKRPSAVGYRKLNKIPGSGECLRQKNINS